MSLSSLVSSWVRVRCATKTTYDHAIWIGFRPATIHLGTESLGSDMGTTSKETRNMCYITYSVVLKPPQWSVED